MAGVEAPARGQPVVEITELIVAVGVADRDRGLRRDVRPQYRDRALGLSRSIRERLTQLVAQLIDEGTVPQWVMPDVMASLILAVANGIVLQTQLDPDGPDQAAMAGQFAGLLLAAALPPDPA